ncbi:MAG: helix-turn-helix transcriptional regulator, partial [Lentimicrobium sp.]|nr:helix-turn-helix transcriptional regulator [Lentimicrobium sp.]
MNSRIALVLKAKNISPSTLADDLGVQRSGISHILNGRNKPSLEFIQKLIKLYPDISIQWILFGEGQMMNPYPGKIAEVVESSALTFPDEKPKPRIMELFSTVDEHEQVEPTPERGKELKNEGEFTLNQIDTLPEEND